MTTQAEPEICEPEIYKYSIGFRCSAGCGHPILQGQLFVQTSRDWHPLERAHAGCVSGDRS